jgi:hypothetical protein
MYKSVLLTNKEIGILKSIVGEYLRENITQESVNLTIILNRLREKHCIENHNECINQT